MSDWEMFSLDRIGESSVRSFRSEAGRLASGMWKMVGEEV